jgi:hypothetical protein
MESGLRCFGDITRTTAHGAVGIFIADVQLRVLQQRLSGLEGALVIRIIADHHFSKQGGARRPQGQQH